MYCTPGTACNLQPQTSAEQVFSLSHLILPGLSLFFIRLISLAGGKHAGERLFRLIERATCCAMKARVRVEAGS